MIQNLSAVTKKKNGSKNKKSRNFKRPGKYLAVLIIGIIVGIILIRNNAFWSIIGVPLHKDIINKYSGEYKFDPLFIMSIVKAESNFQKRAKSHRGAIGLMQLLPSTAEELATELGIENFSEEMLEIPDINIRLGFHYLDKLRTIFGNRKIDMLVAYNAGLLRTFEWRQGKDHLTMEDIKFDETRNFVNEVLTNYEKLKKVQKIKKIIQG